MSSGYYADSSGRPTDRVPGARRQKVLGYIKAANELRQTYQAQIQSQIRGDEDDTMPGGFPDADIVRSGDEEMLLFPSYAHRHIKRRRHGRPEGEDMPGRREDIDRQEDAGDADYWRREWEKYEDANAIVDVDVRGWIYSPQKGPMTRRNRLLVAVARRLSGIPAPDPSPAGSRDASLGPPVRSRTQDSVMSHEEEAAAREADILAQRGQREADAAWKGSYSAQADGNGSAPNSRPSSPSRSSTRTDLSDDASSRISWNQNMELSREELLRANEQLMTRLRPFMTLPLTNTPISVFFYNEQKSISKTVYTDDSGHFNLRAALNFVPDKVKVLVSENMSAVEEVIITESEGVSLISDIDDTVKHSAIASGAREIFKNTFVKDLGELTILGVKEWYNRMAKMGVKMHYVSNSPWQLYPLLKSYFSLAGLPPGSIHLKQYSGMLQGIFEPAAERKKGSVEKIFYDFPQRKFILVGDSGEADLEVYVDIVLANPGRVLGVFIRDVTTAEKKSFFDQAASVSNADSSGGSTTPGRSDAPSSRPSLPSRPRSQPPKVEEDLIDFSDDYTVAQPVSNTSSYESDIRQLQDNNGRPQAPNKPAKPSNLRSFATASSQPAGLDRSNSSSPEVKRPPPPPKPRRPSASVTKMPTSSGSQPPPSSSPRQASSTGRRPAMDSRSSSAYSSYTLRGDEEGYAASARRHLTSAYNALPTMRAQSPTRDGYDSRSPPPPPRRGLSAYPAAAARWATGATGGDPAAGGDGGAPGAPYNKKEEFWKRRWARAEEIMRSRGVVLRTWRVGGDVMDQCVKLAEDEMKGSHGRPGAYEGRQT